MAIHLSEFDPFCLHWGCSPSTDINVILIGVSLDSSYPHIPILGTTASLCWKLKFIERLSIMNRIHNLSLNLQIKT